MYLVTVYIPQTHLETVKTALFEAGAGCMGHYDHCVWQTKGEGQFRPCDGAQPFIGQVGVVETVCEYKIELVCQKRNLNAVIAALRATHPYEEPAFHVIALCALNYL